MPRLYIFAVCEKVIIDDAGLASLIGLFNSISGTIPPEMVDLPRNAVAAKEWCVFAAWKWEPEDAGKEFAQLGDIRYPDGTVFMEIPAIKFRTEPGKMHQNKGVMVGFPIGQSGVYLIQMWLNHEGTRIFGPVSIDVEVRHQGQQRANPV